MVMWFHTYAKPFLKQRPCVFGVKISKASQNTKSHHKMQVLVRSAQVFRSSQGSGSEVIMRLDSLLDWGPYIYIYILYIVYIHV